TAAGGRTATGRAAAAGTGGTGALGLGLLLGLAVDLAGDGLITGHSGKRDRAGGHIRNGAVFTNGRHLLIAGRPGHFFTLRDVGRLQTEGGAHGKQGEVHPVEGHSRLLRSGDRGLVDRAALAGTAGAAGGGRTFSGAAAAGQGEVGRGVAGG